MGGVTHDELTIRASNINNKDLTIQITFNDISKLKESSEWIGYLEEKLGDGRLSGDSCVRASGCGFQVIDFAFTATVFHEAEETGGFTAVVVAFQVVQPLQRPIRMISGTPTLMSEGS